MCVAIYVRSCLRKRVYTSTNNLDSLQYANTIYEIIMMMMMKLTMMMMMMTMVMMMMMIMVMMKMRTR